MSYYNKIVEDITWQNRLTALGELLIDFTEAGQSKDGRRLFEQNPGGEEVEKQLEEVTA